MEARSKWAPFIASIPVRHRYRQPDRKIVSPQLARARRPQEDYSSAPYWGEAELAALQDPEDRHEAEMACVLLCSLLHNCRSFLKVYS